MLILDVTQNHPVLRTFVHCLNELKTHKSTSIDQQEGEEKVNLMEGC